MGTCTSVFLMVTVLLEALASTMEAKGAATEMSMANVSFASSSTSGRMPTVTCWGTAQLAGVNVSDPLVAV
jgi:hypothetical protein